MTEHAEAAAGQTWKRNGQPWREVYIRSLWTDHDGTVYVRVTRNTSRRTQAIKLSTLRRDYYLVF